MAVRLRSLALFDTVWELWVGDLLDEPAVQSPGKKAPAGRGKAPAMSDGALLLQSSWRFVLCPVHDAPLIAYLPPLC